VKRLGKLASVCPMFLLAASLCASAGSKDSFSKVSLTGVSGKVSGSFTFNKSNDTFSNLSLSFNGGVFGGVSASDIKGGKGSCNLGICDFSWGKTLKNGDYVWEKIILNLGTGEYQDFGGIDKGQKVGNFNVPEGGTPLSYLMLCGLAMFAGILTSRKQRRSLHTT